MTDKELKKLSRLELLEILLEQSKENEQLRQDNEALRQENLLLQHKGESCVDEEVLLRFSRVADEIENSLGETRKATKEYITYLTRLASSVQSDVVAAKDKLPAKTVTDVKSESVKDSAEHIDVTPVAPVTPVTVVKVRQLSSKTAVSQPDPVSEEDRRFIKNIVDFYFANINLLEQLPDELKKEFTERFKR